MEAILLAGGFGTRLKHIVNDVPKPMADISGKPFLEYVLDYLSQEDITRVIMAVHYKKECIMDYFRENYRGISIQYSVEETPLFTGGAVKKALSLCTEDYIWVINGDTYFQVPLKAMKDFCIAEHVCAAIAVKRMTHFSRYGKVEMDENSRITAFCEKAPCEEGYINGGIYYIQKSLLNSYPEKFSLENDCFPQLLKGGKIAGFKSDGYFIDIGVPEDYYAAQDYFSATNTSRIV